MGWLQAGFLMPFLKVKTSRGKKILVKIVKATGSDFVPAVELEGMLVFKYGKTPKRLSNYKKGIYRSFNINCVDVDPESWGVVNTSFEAVSTNDPNKTDSLIERALLEPKKIKRNEIFILILLVFIFLGVLFISYKVNYLQTLLAALQSVAGTNI